MACATDDRAREGSGQMSIDDGDGKAASQSRAAWRLVRTMLDDMTRTIEEDAESELELLEGLRVLARHHRLCSELSVDVDHEQPFFFSMNTPLRYVGGRIRTASTTWR